MKKSNMLIAVFAVLAAASVAKAENLAISFDSRNGNEISFKDISRQLEVTETSLPVADDRESEKAFEKTFYKLAKERQEVIFSGKSIEKIFGGDLVMLGRDKEIDILYNRQAVCFVSKTGKNFRIERRTADSRLVELVHGGAFAQSQMKNAVVCTFVEMVMWELVKGVWTEVIKQVKECHTEPDPTYNPGNTGSGGPITWPERSVQF